MERERVGAQQKPIYRFDENKGVWLEGVQLPDGNFYVREVDENEVPEEELSSMERPIPNVNPAQSNFEFNIRVSGPGHELSSSLNSLRNLGFNTEATAPAYGQPALEAPITAPSPILRDMPHAPARYEQPDFDDDWDDDILPEIDATEVHSMPSSRKSQEIQWDEEDDDADDPYEAPAPRQVERVGKPRSRKGVVAIAFLATALVVGLDGAHAASEAKADTAACSSGGFFSSLSAIPCLTGKFIGDMTNPFGQSEPAKTAKKEQK